MHICKQNITLLCTVLEIDRRFFPLAEVIAARIFLNSEVQITVIRVYTPPNLDIEHYNLSLLCVKKSFSQEGKMILLGDFKLRCIDWERMYSPKNLKSKTFLDLYA